MEDGSFESKGKGKGKSGGGSRGDVAVPRDVAELCDRFDCEERLRVRLARCLEDRQATRKEDLASLWETLENARSPPGLLVVKMKEMEDGTFVAKGRGKGRRDDRRDD